jgi:hypothetical protein
MSNKSTATVARWASNSFHLVGLDERGAIVLRQKWSRAQVEARLANIPPCLIGIEACVGEGTDHVAPTERGGLTSRNWAANPLDDE